MGTMTFAASGTLCQGWAPVGGELTPVVRGWCVTDHGRGPRSDLTVTPPKDTGHSWALKSWCHKVTDA